MWHFPDGKKSTGDYSDFRPRFKRGKAILKGTGLVVISIQAHALGVEGIKDEEV